MGEYRRQFNYTSRYWTTDPVQNLQFLKNAEHLCNLKFKSKGFLFLSEVFEILDLEPAKDDDFMQVGWWCSNERPWGDNYIDFNIYNRKDPIVRDFINCKDAITYIDFNIDGRLADYLMDAAIKAGGPEKVEEFFESSNAFKLYLEEKGLGVTWLS